MAFTQPELDSIAAAVIDYHEKQGIRSNTIQKKPLLRVMDAAAKRFPGGKGLVTKRVKGVYSTQFTGFTHDDTVTYETPANILQAEAPWREHHSGITLTHTELKIDGISVVDSANSRRTTTHSRVERTRLAGLFEDKLEDLEESHARGLNTTMWLDGTQDAKATPGVKSIVVDDPTGIGTVLGIDQVAEDWWRNRVDLAIAATAANASDQILVQKMQVEMRQLRRYGGDPNVALCGSDFLNQLELELRAKGQYTDSGWNRSGSIDISVADPAFAGMVFEYDPSLDDLTPSESDRCYILDTNLLYPYVMEGEWWKSHSPARPSDQYVMYRAYTSTFAMMCQQRNSCGVYKLA